LASKFLVVIEIMEKHYLVSAVLGHAVEVIRTTLTNHTFQLTVTYLYFPIPVCFSVTVDLPSSTKLFLK